MLKVKPYLIVFLSAFLSALPAAAQIKLAALPGAPGTFTDSTGLVFAARGNTAFASNPGSGLLSKFRVTTGEVVGTLQLAPGIGPVALSRDERTLAVLGVTTQKIYLVNVSGEQMAVRKETGKDNTGFTARCNLLFSPDNAKLFVADPSKNTVLVFDVADGMYERSIGVGINPNTLSPIPKENGRYFVVLCSGKKAGDEEAIWTVDTFTYGVVDLQVLHLANTEPYNNVAYTITSSHAFIPIYNDNRLAVYDLNTHILASRALDGKGPTKAFTAPNGRWLAVICAQSSSVAVYALPEAASTVWRIDIPGASFGPDTRLSFSPDSRTLYVPLRNSSDLLSFDVQNFAAGERIRTGRGPLSVATNPETSTLVSLDLDSNELSLIALNPSTLYLPDLTQTASEYSGVAVANFDTETANIALVAKDNRGELLPGTNNPAILTVPANRQISRVLAETFGFDRTALIEGYVEGYTLGGSLTVLYLRGTISQTQLDGFFADSEAGKLLGFSRISDGISRFGSQTATEIVILNPTSKSTPLTFKLYGDTLEGKGKLIGYASGVLPAHHRIRGKVSEFCPSGRDPLENVYLEVDAETVIKGMAVVKIGDSTALIPAKPRGLLDTEFVAVQYASGGGGVLQTPIFSNLGMTNSTTRPMQVTAQVQDEKGNIIPEDSQPLVLSLAPYQTVSGGANELFGFPDPLTDPALYQGTLRISADHDGLMVNLLYGDARNGAYLTSSDVHAQEGSRFALGHLAEGRFGAPPKGMYTGIAMFNPNRTFSTVKVEARSPDNILLGQVTLTVDKWARMSKTLGQLMPAITQQNGGTIIVTSDLPIYLFEVFGGSDGEFLVAVPPLILAP